MDQLSPIFLLFTSAALGFDSIFSLENLAISPSSKLFCCAVSGRKSCFSDQGSVHA